MLHFIKNNRSVKVKMIVNQIGMIFFGLMLSMATNQNNSLFLAASIFSVRPSQPMQAIRISLIWIN